MFTFNPNQEQEINIPYVLYLPKENVNSNIGISFETPSTFSNENLENILYTRITRELKNSIIISVGHRSSIKSFHNLFLEWQEDLNWRLVPNEEYVEEGVYTENTGCDEEIHDDDLVKRFRNAYSYKNSPAGKPWYKRLFGRKNGED